MSRSWRDAPVPRSWPAGGQPGAAGAGVGSVFIIAVGQLVLGLVVILVVTED
ncbi:hypothetical protein [Streptomyces sp. ISL-98]|uniref:hypothetical protein n=1 Tax=Streptomyces sp. ISL-98 TaxID=2819192 RepID=UPI002036412E|nr:hypothetical protein [Streptomyces sp. ISL-98]